MMPTKTNVRAKACNRKEYQGRFQARCASNLKSAFVPRFHGDIGAQDNQPVTERHHLHKYVHFVKSHVRNTKEEYTERLNNHMEPLKQEFRDTKQYLEASKALELSTDEDVTKAEDHLPSVPHNLSPSTDRRSAMCVSRLRFCTGSPVTQSFNIPID